MSPGSHGQLQDGPGQDRSAPLSQHSPEAAQNKQGDSATWESGWREAAGCQGTRSSFQRPPGPRQESLFKFSIPREEGLIDLEGQKEKFRMGKGKCLLYQLRACKLKM